jgi:Ulp1 family protease
MNALQIIGTQPLNLTRHLRRQGLPDIQFDAQDLNRLASATSRLNDVCLNGGAAVLQHFYSSSTLSSAPHSFRCAILSTFDLPRVRYNASDQDLWRNIRHSSYWSKDTWIIPIHRTRPAEHWVLAVARTASRRLLLFDSFAEAYPWRKEVKVLYYLCIITTSPNPVYARML